MTLTDIKMTRFGNLKERLARSRPTGASSANCDAGVSSSYIYVDVMLDHAPRLMESSNYQ